MWWVFQIGAREHYAVPRALARVGLLGQEWLQPGLVQASQGLPQVWFRAWPGEWLAQAWAPPWLELLGQVSSLSWGPPPVGRVPVLAWCLERED